MRGSASDHHARDRFCPTRMEDTRLLKFVLFEELVRDTDTAGGDGKGVDGVPFEQPPSGRLMDHRS